MPTYTIPGPGGKIYSIDGPEGATREQIISAIKRKLGMSAEPPAAPKESGFLSSFGQGASTLLGGKAAAQFATASSAEQDALRKKFIETQTPNTQNISYDEVDNIPEFWQWLKQTAGQSFGFMATPAAAAVAAKKLAGAPNIVAKGIGYGLMGAQYVIDNLSRQAQEQEKDIAEGRPARATNLGAAISGAAVQAGLDVALVETAFLPLLQRFPGLKSLFEAGETQTQGALKELTRAYKAGELKVTNGLVKGFLFGSAVEIPQEIAQQMVERWQAGLPLADAEAKKEYYESAVGALALGGTMGSVQEAMVTQGQKGLARDEIQREEDALAAQAAERQRLIDEQKAATAAQAQTQGVQPPSTAGTTTTAAPTRVVQSQSNGLDKEALKPLVNDAAELVKALAANTNGRETVKDQWRDALMAQFNLDEKSAGRLVALLHENKVTSRNYGKKDGGGHLLNKLYEPSLREQRQQLLSDLDPEIRRVSAIAAPEDKAALDKVIKQLDPSKRITEAKTTAFTATLNQLLGKYGTVEGEATVGAPPTTQGPSSTVPPSTTATETVAAEPAAEGGIPRIDVTGMPLDHRPDIDPEAPRAEKYSIRFLEEGGKVYLAQAIDEKGRVIGDMSTETGEGVADMFVSEANRRRGINTKLFDALRTVYPNIGFGHAALTHDGRRFVRSMVATRENVTAPRDIDRNYDGKDETTETVAAEPVAAEPVATETVAAEPAAAAEPVATETAPQTDEEKVLAAFKAAGKVNTSLIMETLGLKKMEAVAFMNKLFMARKVVKIGESNRYRLAEEGENVPRPRERRNMVDEEDSGERTENLLARLREERAARGEGASEESSDRAGTFAKKKLAERALEVSTGLEKDGPLDIGGGIKLKYANNGYGVDAINEAGERVGYITTRDGSNIEDVEVKPDYRRRGIASKLFDRLDQVHQVLGFGKSALSRDGEELAVSLAYNRIGKKNEVNLPKNLRQRVDERFKAGQIEKARKYITDHMARFDGAVPFAYDAVNATSVAKEEVDTALRQLVQEGVIKTAPEKEVTSTVTTGATAETAAESETEVSEEEAVRSGVLDFVSEKSRSEADFAKEFAEDVMPQVAKALSDLVAKGDIVRDKDGKYRSSKATYETEATKPLQPAKPRETVGKTGKTKEELTEILEKIYAALSKLDRDYTPARIKKLLKAATENENTLLTYVVEAGNSLKKFSQREEVFGPNANLWNGRTTLTEATQILLDGKPVESYLNFVRKYGSMFEKVMADRISRVFADLARDGYPVKVVSVNSVAEARRVYGNKWQNVGGMAGLDENGLTVHLTGNFSDTSGFNLTTMLHEMNHAATYMSYHLGKMFPNEHKREAAIAKDMDKLQSHVKKELQGLLQNNKLTREEAHLVSNTNFLKDSQELIAWGMSNPVAQNLLEKIHYGTAERGKRRSAWDKFVGLIRTLLGFSPKADTALSELLHNYAKLTTSTTVSAVSDAAGRVTVLPSSFSVSQQPSATSTQGTYTAPPIHQGGFDDTTQRLSKQESVRLEPKKGLRETFKNLFSQTVWEKIVTNFQNERRPLLKLSEYLSSAGVLNVLDRTNDLFGEITRSMAMSENIMNETMWRHMVDVDKAIVELSKATGKGKDVILAELHQYAMGRTEKERREVFYEMNVPMNNKVNTTLDANIVGNIMVTARDADGKPIKNAPAVALASISAPAARLRQIIKAELDKNQDLVSNGYAEKLRKALQELIYRNNMQNVDGTVDGYTPIVGPKANVKMSTDINDRIYDVIGPYSRAQIDEMVARYNAALADPKTGAILKRLMDEKTGSLAMLQKATIEADKRSNYWSNPVNNRKAFYGWKYYVPLKGRVEDSTKAALDELDFSGERLGSGFNDNQAEMGGRATDSENPILQTLVDATKASIRYGRTGSMNAIANLIDADPKTGKQYLKGKKVANIPFELRNTMVDNKDYGGPDKFFVYRPDGSIDIYKVSDDKMKEAIRRTFRERNRLVELGNSITSAVGHLHTRYNVAFHPYNFVRDALTNAFTMGAEFGPTMSAKLLSAVATRTAQSGMLLRAGKISGLYKEGKLDEIRRMARAGDVFAADAVRFYELGGRVTYLSGTDIREQGERMMRDVRRGNVARTKEFLDGYVDTWADAFELTSRVSTFGVMRDYYKSKGLSDKEAETRATTYAKNLANFEQVGKYGREAGALFMFFRPAATGAVRAIDALMPAFQSWESYKKGIPEDILGDVNSTEYKKIEKEFLSRKKSAQAMMMALAGAGAAMWTMAWMMADDDEMGRNRIGTDKMALWTRNIRLPLSVFGKEYDNAYLQLPWGFGLGAFGAMGAQVAGVAGGYTTIGEAIPNFITIALDSYVPVPVARIDPTENFPAFAATTFIPSVARPFVEYAMNVDSLGREIYNDRQTRYGDAFTGGRNTPQLWKDASRWIFNVTNGAADVSPDTMLFWANNYADGVTRIAQSGYGLSQFATTDRDLNVKEDFAPIASFIGRASNYDGEKFAKLEQHMRELNQRIRSLERDPDMMREYIENNEREYYAVQNFNLNVNGWVRRLRSMRNQVEASDQFSPRVKQEKLEQINLSSNYVKRGMLRAAMDAGISL